MPFLSLSEREACYAPLLAALEKYVPLNDKGANSKRVLVPGAGLGRLTFEVVNRGYACQVHSPHCLPLLVVETAPTFPLFPSPTKCGSHMHYTVAVRHSYVLPSCNALCRGTTSTTSCS